MTTDLSPETFVEAQMVDLIRLLHAVREAKSRATREDSSVTAQLKPYVKALPARELWDQERNLGVAIKEVGGPRWIDWDTLSDEEIVFLARKGCLALAATSYDAAVKVAQSTGDLDAIEGLGNADRAIHPGAQEQLILLPEKKGR